MIPSFSIMGISREYEDMAKIQSYSGDLKIEEKKLIAWCSFNNLQPSL
jgi:hypothetical protein